jgi:hypothetical protein
MKSHIDAVLFRLLRGAQHFHVQFSSSLRDARMFALQCALHKRYPLLAAEGYASLSRPPVSARFVRSGAGRDWRGWRIAWPAVA